jgi:hypothetical protein
VAKADGQPIAGRLFDQKAKIFVCRLSESRPHDRELIARSIDSFDSVFRENVDIGVFVDRGELKTSLQNFGVADEAHFACLVFGQLRVSSFISVLMGFLILLLFSCRNCLTYSQGMFFV